MYFLLLKYEIELSGPGTILALRSISLERPSSSALMQYVTVALTKGQICIGVSEGHGGGFYVSAYPVGMLRQTLPLLICGLPAGTQSHPALAADLEL